MYVVVAVVMYCVSLHLCGEPNAVDTPGREILKHHEYTVRA